MTDLEDRLRVMLQERAEDVTSLPDFFSTLPAARRRVGRTPLLVAAAVVAVLAVTLGTVLLHGSASTTAPARRPTTAPRPSIPVPHATRQVALAWFGMGAIAGFDLHFRTSEPGHRTMGLRARADHDLPVGCNGCAIISDVVLVFDAERFDATKYGVTGWTRDRVGGTLAYRGSMTWFGERNGPRVPTLAWQFAPRRWALVQGVTPYGGRRATLHALATAVRPTTSVPIELPFRLRYVPDLPIVRVNDDVAGGYAFDLSFGDPLGTQFSITLWPGKKSFAGLYDSTHAASQLVGGLPGSVGPAGVAVRYHDGIAVLGLGDQNSTLSPAHQLENARIADGIEWANGDGRAPYFAADNAIP